LNLTTIVKNGRRFLKENGLYVFAAAFAGACVKKIRNRMLARKFRVKKISIGPGAHLRGLSSIQMGEDLSTGPGLWLEAVTRNNEQTFSPRIIIGNHVRISHGTHIGATNYVEIGDNLLMGSKVVVIDHNHGLYSGNPTSLEIAPSLRPLDHDGKVIVGANVWLCDGVAVLPGSTIGKGCVIAANSVVNGTIPPFTIAAGVPARVVKVFDAEKNQWIKPE
jgi:lipopolysaccharide O-acetyltransferase